MSFICSHYLSHFIYHCCFNIVTFVILCQCMLCICQYLIYIFVWDHNGNKCLHYLASSFYLMYFVFISYVYLYNVLHSILNKSIHPCSPVYFVFHLPVILVTAAVSPCMENWLSRMIQNTPVLVNLYGRPTTGIIWPSPKPAPVKIIVFGNTQEESLISLPIKKCICIK